MVRKLEGNMEKITFVIPSRNNLEFLKLAYKSLKLLKGNHDILVLNDASEDGTSEWLSSLEDDNLIIYTNPGPERIGIVGMFDKGIEMARTDIIFAFHSDMVAGKNLDVNTLKYLERGKVVSATRVEPPLHPPGPEKIIKDFGVEPDDFILDRWYSVDDVLLEQKNKTTEGIFAPWCMYKDDFLTIGGHDKLFAPQSREDSCLFSRMAIKGYGFIQSWDALVYHFTSRGSRFNKYSGGDIGVDSLEWQITNQKNTKNYIRKFGNFTLHDEYLKPIVQNKYNIGLIIENCTENLIEILEPWVATLYVDCKYNSYIEKEQPNTLYLLNERIRYIDSEKNNDILVKFDANLLTSELLNNFLLNLSDILDDSGELGNFQYEIFDISINSLKTYQNDLLKIENNIKNSRIF